VYLTFLLLEHLIQILRAVFGLAIMRTRGEIFWTHPIFIYISIKVKLFDKDIKIIYAKGGIGQKTSEMRNWILSRSE